MTQTKNDLIGITRNQLVALALVVMGISCIGVFIGTLIGYHYGIRTSEEYRAAHCTYEDMECPNAQAAAKEYQLELTMDSVYVYDANFKVGVIEWERLPGLDSLLSDY